jgi:hypothetical protein
MLKRLWFVLSVFWAALLMGVFVMDDSNRLSWGFLLTAFGPLALPKLASPVARFVVTGSPIRSRGPVPYRRP